jgi:hypothetical protein
MTTDTTMRGNGKRRGGVTEIDTTAMLKPIPVGGEDQPRLAEANLGQALRRQRTIRRSQTSSLLGSLLQRPTRSRLLMGRPLCSSTMNLQKPGNHCSDGDYMCSKVPNSLVRRPFTMVAALRRIHSTLNCCRNAAHTPTERVPYWS